MKKNLLLLCLLVVAGMANAKPKSYDVIAYYTGDAATLRTYPLEKLTHVIYSFLHLKGNQLAFGNEQSKKNLLEIVALKKEFPKLKVMISLGGWEGCYTCSPTFATKENRIAFATSVVEILQTTGTDGIDLDWEYPTIPGPPGHPFIPEDKANFTDLVKELRSQMGKKYELSFAAGGFQKFLDESVDWDALIPLVDRINLMTYDLINGYSKSTGHHTALFSRPEQKESTDNCVQDLLKRGVPAKKLVIGAAFYCRMWKEVSPEKNGLYQSGIHTGGVNYKNFQTGLTPAQGFTAYWDETAQAMYYYNAEKKLFATMDEPRSIKAKVNYVKQHKLGGIMFWQLMDDAPVNGLLSEIDTAIKE